MGDLAAVAARAGIAGIPWADLSARLGGKDPIFDTTYIYQYLIPAADAANAVMDKYQFWPTPAEIQGLDADAVHAYQQAADVLGKKADTVLQAAQAGATQLSATDALTMPLTTFRVNVLSGYDTALYGATMHVGNLQLVKSVTALVVAGKLTPDAGSLIMRKHADSCYRTLRSIALLDQAGAFVVVPKKATGTSGLGFAPVALVAALTESGPVGWAVIAIVGVLVIGLVYALVYYLQTTAEQNQQALDIIAQNCAVAREKGDSATLQQCNQLAADARKGLTDALVNAATSTIQKAIPWLVGAGLVVGGVYFAPLVVRKLKAARAEARS